MAAPPPPTTITAAAFATPPLIPFRRPLQNPNRLNRSHSRLRSSATSLSSFVPPKQLPGPPLLKNNRFSLLTPRSSATSPPATSPAPSIFGPLKELTGPQALVESLSPTARAAVSAVILAASIAAGYALGLRIGRSNVAAIGGAAVVGAVGGAAVYVVNSSVPEVAAASLRNLVAGYDDPVEVKREEVDAIAKKYGVSKQDEKFKAELCELYSRFVSSILPPGSEDLKGNEVELITKFKEGLGIDDPDAASVHVEIGRQLYRQRLETGDRESDLEQRKAFQKLIYISALVFGEASKFLLPWKRLFKVTDSQVEIAIRDNAQRLYFLKLNSITRDIQVQQLKDLREAQLRYKLSDDIAAEMFREHTRKLAEENISRALSVLKSRTKATMGAAPVLEELESILKFNNLLISLSKESEVDLPPGVGPISLIGGEYDGDRKIDDLKLLYRTYAEESFENGRLQVEKLVSLNNLRNIFGLGKREAEVIMSDVTARLYRKRLSQAFSNGELDAAPSKAQYLQTLCEELHFDPDSASKIHEEIYRQKLQQFVEDGELSEAEVSSLQRLRVNFCIHQEAVDAAHADICGRLFEKVVKEAIASGVEGYDAEIRASVRKAAQGLRLTTEAAMDIASKAVRKMFLTYVQRARGAGSRTEAARELKKMIAYNSLVVTELIADIKGESTLPEPAVIESKQTDDEDEWESLQTIRKTRPSKELEAKMGKHGQTEINLKDDLSEREKADLYRTYLIYCLTGEVTSVPFGAQITTKKDNSEFLLLSQLGGILGLTTKEIVEVHRSIAEQAFIKQAEVILADGQLTPAKIEQLNEAQKEVGLPAEYAQKIIKNITTTKLAASLETAVSRGMLGIQQVRELKKASVDIDSMISEKMREGIFRKTVEEIFSSGTGEFDEAEIYEKYPADLSIDAEKAKDIVKELAQTRLANSLVQAVALLRQRNKSGVVASLNDMLACDKAVPAEPLSWSSPEELADLYCVYLKSIPKPEKLSRLQHLLGISDATAAALRDNAAQGSLSISEEEEEFAF